MNKDQLFYYSWMVAISAVTSAAIALIGGNGWFITLGVIWFLVMVTTILLEAFSLKPEYREKPHGLEWFFLVFFSVFPPLALWGIIWEINSRKDSQENKSAA